MKRPGNIARYLLIVTLGLNACSSAAFGQTSSNRWSSNGPYGGSISWFAIAPGNPSILYAAFNDRLFKSTDSGATWHEVGIGIDARYDLGPLQIAVARTNSELIYAATHYLGDIFRSVDGGAHWNLVYARRADD